VRSGPAHESSRKVDLSKHERPSKAARRARREAARQAEELAEARGLFDDIHDAAHHRQVERLAGIDVTTRDTKLEALFDRKRVAQADPVVDNVTDLQVAPSIGDFWKTRP
jgi:hypothetical protein